MPEPDDNLHLEIGHVLFIDIVDYSKLLIEEQKERLNQLTAIVLATAPVREATDEQLVRLPTGGGMALVFHHSAEEPARCALEIGQALKEHPEKYCAAGQAELAPALEPEHDQRSRADEAGDGLDRGEESARVFEAFELVFAQCANRD